MEVPKAWPTVALPILETIEFSRSQPAILTNHTFRIPFIEFTIDVLSIILPLVLLWIFNEVFVIEDR